MVTGGTYMKKYLFAFFWACLVIAGYAQEQKGTVYGVAFYNLENLLIRSTMRVRKIMNICPTEEINGTIRNISRN